MGSFLEVPAPFGDTLGCMPTARRYVGLLWFFLFAFVFVFFSEQLSYYLTSLLYTDLFSEGFLGEGLPAPSVIGYFITSTSL